MDTSDFWDRSADKLVGISYVVAGLFAVGLIGWQCLLWLQFGDWLDIPFRYAFEFASIDLSSTYSPNRWLGLAMVAQWILGLPLAFAGPACVILVAHGWKHFVSSGPSTPQGGAP